MAFDGQFWDGFDSYGPTGFQPYAAGVEDVRSTLFAGEWTSALAWGLGVEDVTCTVVDSLFGPGQGLRVAWTGNASIFGIGAGGISRTLEQSYGRICFGIYLKAHLTVGKRQGIVFGDTGQDQIAITIEPSGQIGFRRCNGVNLSAMLGDLVATSNESVADGEAVCLAGEIVIDGSATARSVPG
jgi:hypothetical protein